MLLDVQRTTAWTSHNSISIAFLAVNCRRIPPGRGAKLTASSAQRVRLVVTLTEAGSTLRCRRKVSNPNDLFQSRSPCSPGAARRFMERTYSSWRWWLGVWLDDDRRILDGEEGDFLVECRIASPNLWVWCCGFGEWDVPAD